MAFAGFFVNLSSIPPVLRWLQWVAPLKYTLEALTVNEVGAGLMINDELAGAKVQISAEIIMETLYVGGPLSWLTRGALCASVADRLASVCSLGLADSASSNRPTTATSSSCLRSSSGSP